MVGIGCSGGTVLVRLQAIDSRLPRKKAWAGSLVPFLSTSSLTFALLVVCGLQAIDSSGLGMFRRPVLVLLGMVVEEL